MTISVVIGTKDRPTSLSRLLDCLSRQIVKSNEIIIIDDGEDSSEVLKRVLTQFNLPYKYFKKDSKGLVKSRRMGIQKSSGDVILFLDDDVILEEHYVDTVLKTFQEDRTGRLGGVGGLTECRIGLLQRVFLKIFCLDGTRQGAILPSGCGVVVRGANEAIDVKWLSGCNMAFRRDVFEEFDFDEAYGGNGWGDDRDFSYRVSKKFKLQVTPKTKVIHREEPAGRLPKEQFGYIEIEHFCLFFKKNMPKNIKTWLCFYWALIGIMLKNLLILNVKQFIGNLYALKTLFSKG